MLDACTNYKVLLKNTSIWKEKTRFLWPDLAYHCKFDLIIYAQSFLNFASLGRILIFSYIYSNTNEFMHLNISVASRKYIASDIGSKLSCFNVAVMGCTFFFPERMLA